MPGSILIDDTLFSGNCDYKQHGISVLRHFYFGRVHFLYARHLTDVLCYGAVRLSVRPSVRPYVASSTILVGRI